MIIRTKIVRNYKAFCFDLLKKSWGKKRYKNKTKQGQTIVSQVDSLHGIG